MGATIQTGTGPCLDPGLTEAAAVDVVAVDDEIEAVAEAGEARADGASGEAGTAEKDSEGNDSDPESMPEVLASWPGRGESLELSTTRFADAAGLPVDGPALPMNEELEADGAGAALVVGGGSGGGGVAPAGGGSSVVCGCDSEDVGRLGSVV